MLLASSGLKPEMLLNILQCIEQPPQERNYPDHKVNKVYMFEKPRSAKSWGHSSWTIEDS